MAIEIKNIPSQLPNLAGIQELGRGAWGVVTQVAVDKKIYALKESLPPFQCGRISEEGHIMTCEEVEAEIYSVLQSSESSPNSPWFLQCHAFRAKKDNFSLLIDYFDGETLSQAHFEEGTPRMPLQSIMDFAEQMTGALSYLKTKKIIHCDLNPGNILTNGKAFKIIDFGASAITGVHKMLPMSNWPSYRAPSLVHCHTLGGFSHEVDTFALGCILRALITEKPFPFPYNDRPVEEYWSQKLCDSCSDERIREHITSFEREVLTYMHRVTLGKPTGKFASEASVYIVPEMPEIPCGIGQPRTPREVSKLYAEVRQGEDDDTLVSLATIVDRMMRWEPNEIERIEKDVKKARYPCITADGEKEPKKRRLETTPSIRV